jgi:glutamate racemase
MYKKESPIGVIDSGVGGFSVVLELQSILPSENILYLGDGANTPYGNHDEKDILKMTRYMLQFMDAQGVKALLVACNTISCLIDSYRDEMSCPVLSIVDAGAEAVREANLKKVGIISTCFTEKTKCYPRQIQKISPQTKVICYGSPELARIVEANIGKKEGQLIIDKSLKEILEPLVYVDKIDNCVLGCTHYPLVKENIHRLYPELSLIDPAVQMVKNVERCFRKHDSANDSTKRGELHIYTTGSIHEYNEKAKCVGLEAKTVKFLKPMNL